MEELIWKVVPICGFQRLDVRPEDLLNGGDFRKCDTYRGGGGYDQFPAICGRRLGKRLHKQFVVQLYGCNLDCPYCYVTRSGVWGQWKPYTTDDLVKAFVESKQDIFHLMGGAPALYLKSWPSLIEKLPEDAVFHSDFLLTEGKYPPHVLRTLAEFPNTLFAVDVKGLTSADHLKNTRKEIDWSVFWGNLEALVHTKVNFYITFTNPDHELLADFLLQVQEKVGLDVLEDSFSISLVKYAASQFVDIRPLAVRP